MLRYAFGLGLVEQMLFFHQTPHILSQTGGLEFTCRKIHCAISRRNLKPKTPQYHRLPATLVRKEGYMPNISLLC